MSVLRWFAISLLLDFLIMKTDTLFYWLFKRPPKLALELLGLDYAKDFYGRLFSEITPYLYQNKPNRDWLVLVIYPNRGIEKNTSVEFLSFLY